MPVITEGMLRKLDKEGQLNQVHITEKDILTPSAREFLNSRKIDYKIEKSEEFAAKENSEDKTENSQNKNVSENKVSQKRQYRDYVTGGIYEKKPEYMTQLFGNDLVVKNHKRIALRGKFDVLQA